MIYSARPKPRSLSDTSLSLRQLSVPIDESPRFAGPARLEGDSPLGNTEARLAASDGDPFDLELATHILARIESRLPGRIRHLAVHTTENAVVLTGECSTFYTKQVAQHAAMGVLEYEQLINNIDVRTVK